jgi:DNA repair protein RadC
MTEQLSSAALVLGLPLLDHVVVAREGACSAVEAMRHGD